MEITLANMIKEFVNSQKFDSATDVTAAIKERFAEALQQVKEYGT